MKHSMLSLSLDTEYTVQEWQLLSVLILQSPRWLEMSQLVADNLRIIVGPLRVSNSAPCSRDEDFHSTFPLVGTSYQKNITTFIQHFCIVNYKSRMKLLMKSLLIMTTTKRHEQVQSL